MRFLRRRRAVLAVCGLLAIGLATFGLRMLYPWPPADGSAEAGFARDMQAHHAQAVQMALIVRDRTEDQEVRTLAYDIATTQQHQIGQMYAWLQMWGLSQASLRAQMAWMGADHTGMAGMTETGQGTGSMPGMATPAQIEELEQASGKDAEILFLRLMIKHHQGGAEMASAALRLSDQPQVSQLAEAIVTSQRAETDLMRRMLTARGADPSSQAGSRQ
ncbi:DUF305 domain-containing protein [Nonomuraea sp. NPDC049309]|uniref:DUF305 domain-containing protein n=1 Tax=Nonomuraea sp. NPDC049309 TaxID=3364350 RepID=UPI003712C8DE